MRLNPVSLEKKQKIWQHQAHIPVWSEATAASEDDTHGLLFPIPMNSLHFILLAWLLWHFQFAVSAPIVFLLQVFPYFHGIRLSTFIAVDSVLTMAACELMKEMYGFGSQIELVLNTSLTIYTFYVTFLSFRFLLCATSEIPPLWSACGLSVRLFLLPAFIFFLPLPHCKLDNMI